MTETRLKIKPTPEQAYLAMLNVQCRVVQKLLVNLADLLVEPRMSDPKWVGEANACADNIAKLYRQAKDMTAPAKYRPLHGKWLECHTLTHEAISVAFELANASSRNEAAWQGAKRLFDLGRSSVIGLTDHLTPPDPDDGEPMIDQAKTPKLVA